MRIADKTPFRDKNGQVDLMGQLNGMLKFGPGWYPEIKGQDSVVLILNKFLDRKYILLRNFVLPDTDIMISMILIGPPGIYIISVLNQSGSFSIRDDEWGGMSRSTFSPARVNLVQRLIKLGRVVNLYLNRNGFKGEIIIEPILIAANPGLHIEQLRPAVKVVLNDEIERFAISLTQARPVLAAARVADIGVVLVKGQKDQNATVPESGTPASTTVSAGTGILDNSNPPTPQEQDLSSPSTNDNFGLSNKNKLPEDQPQSSSQPTGAPAVTFENFDGDFQSFFAQFDSPPEISLSSQDSFSENDTTALQLKHPGTTGASEPGFLSPTSIVPSTWGTHTTAPQGIMPETDSEPGPATDSESGAATLPASSEPAAGDTQETALPEVMPSTASRSQSASLPPSPELFTWETDTTAPQESTPEIADQSEPTSIPPSSEPVAGDADETNPDESTTRTVAAPTPASLHPSSPFGLTRSQILILGGILVFWLLLVAAFFFLINLS